MNRIIKTICDALEDKKITLVDVGASGGINNRWNKFNDVLQVVGFEPNEEEFLKLTGKPNYTWFNSALGSSEGKQTLYITEHKSNVSVYRPNYQLIDQLQWTCKPNPGADFNIVEETEIVCKTLDEAMATARIRPDFLKVDTQGSELDILKGARRVLKEDLVLLEIEVEFAPLYKDQPLFADIDIFVRQFGFILQDIGNILYMKPRGCSGIGGPKGRIIAADALYIKDICSSYQELISQGTVKVYAALIGYLAYGYPELGLTLLNELSKRGHKLLNHERICEELLRFKRTSKFWSRIPKRQRLLKAASFVLSNLHDVEHCFWDVTLGNRLRLR